MGLEFFKYLLISLGGAICAACLLLMYTVSTSTRTKALHGSQKEKYFAYGVRIATAVLCYVVVVVIGRIFKSSTDQTAPEALVLICSCVAVLIYGSRKLKLRKQGHARDK